MSEQRKCQRLPFDVARHPASRSVQNRRISVQARTRRVWRLPYRESHDRDGSMSTTMARTNGRYGTLGRVLVVDLTTRTSRVEELPEEVYRQYLGGYGLGAYLMWKHFPAGTDPLAPEACFAIVSGLPPRAR